MKQVLRPVCLSLLALALSACGHKKQPEQSSAAGQILQHSVSDAMLPYDTVRSQPPMAEPTGAGVEPGPMPAVRVSAPKPQETATGAPTAAPAPTEAVTPGAE
jgi:hypothetical protein